MQVNGIMRLCCTNDENREILVCKKGNVIMVHGKPYIAVTTKERCKVCGRKHYSMDPEPMNLGMRAR